MGLRMVKMRHWNLGEVGEVTVELRGGAEAE